MTSTWDLVVGQSEAVSTLVRSVSHPLHAYLFVGPEGCGKEEASRAFAAQLLSGSDDPTNRVCSLVLRSAHADVHEIRREGASILKEQAIEVIRLASTTPVESKQKVIIMHEVDLMQDVAAARLLKTIEEPADGVFLILLADQLVPMLTTIASRCVVVHFSPLSESTITAALESEGVSTERARAVAHACHGSMTRARLLSTDSQLFERLKFFGDIPYQLNGTGAVVSRLVDEATALINTALEPLVRQHEVEIAEWEQRMSLVGGRKSGRKEMEDRHKREVRKYRTDEIRSGLSEMATVYRDAMKNNPDLGRPDALVGAIERLHKASSRLSLNVNEALLLREVIWSLPSLSAHDTLVFD